MEMPCLVFCCYARKDQEFLQDLKTQLKALEREGLITVKADIDISPGAEWETNIIHHLEVADIVLLLISPDFIASDYCFNEEMQRALIRHEQGTARVVPVIVRPASWLKMPFGKLQALPKDAAPISTWQDRDTAFLNVAKGIRTVVRELTAGIAVNRKSELPVQPSAQEDSSSTSGQERNNMDTKDDSSQHPIVNKGTVYGQFIGGQQDQVIIGETIHVTQIPNERKNGIHALEVGAKALSNEDYSSARRELRIAIEKLDQEQQKKEAAKARYLQALAVLDGERPRDKGITAMGRVNELLNAAIRLDRCNAYVMTRAVIMDSQLPKQAKSTSISDYDKALLEYLECCQPELYRQIHQVFGI